jgi:transcriptional regulator with XRE-family HTH domain
MKSSEKKYKEIESAFDNLFNEKVNDFEIDAKVIASRFLNDIKEIADYKNINRKELADLIGTSPSYLTQLYRGTKILNLVTVAKLKKVLDLEIEIKVTNNYYKTEVDESISAIRSKRFLSPKNNINWLVIPNLNVEDQYDKYFEVSDNINKTLIA